MNEIIVKMEEIKPGHTYVQWVVALLASSISLCYGFENGWISPITNYLQSDASPTGEPLSDSDVAWIACVMSMTATTGAPLSSYLAEVFGRRISVFLLTIPLALSWLIKILYSSTSTLILARVISGFTAGGVFNVIPMYMKEISQDNIRGALGSLVVLMQNTGMFLMYLMGAYMKYYTVMYISLALTIVSGILMLKAPESPAFLVKKGKVKQASRTIALLRGVHKSHEIVQTELDFLRKEEARFKSLPDISVTAIVKEPSCRRGLILMTCIFTFQAFNGAFVITTYASAVLVSTGVKLNVSPQLLTLSLPLMMIIASLCLLITVEKCGRKILLCGAFFITFTSMSILGAATLVQQTGGSVPSWLPVLAMTLTVSMYAGGVNPIPSIITTEMFSYQIRAKVMGSIVMYSWLTTFISVAIYTPISKSFGQHSTFFIYGVINLLGSVFTFIFLPETKGKNDEEIRQILTGEQNGDKKTLTFFFK